MKTIPDSYLSTGSIPEMFTIKSCRQLSSPRGFTLVEMLVAMTVIAILAGLLVVGAQRALITAREFAIRNEMQQLQSAIEQFRNEFGFYPPSFANITSADQVLVYLNRIAPNHNESQVVNGQRRIDIWFNEVGQFLASSDPRLQGADLVFWLSGIARDKQFPLTHFFSPTVIVANAAHTFPQPNDPNDPVKRVFFDFQQSRLNIDPSVAGGKVAGYSQSDRAHIPYLYLDARNYFPSNLYPTGAYVNPQATADDVNLAMTDPTIFKQVFPNPDSFQLISFGLDGLPGETMNPNDYSLGGPAAADNFVNFGPQPISRLSTLIEAAREQ